MNSQTTRPIRQKQYSKPLTVIGLLLLCSAINAQNVSRSVVGNAGDYYEHLLFGNIHWTVGETAVSQFQNNLELGEGFHQVYYDLVVKNHEPLPDDWEVSVYPNPTTNQLNISVPENDLLQAQLFSSSGQLIQNIKDFTGAVIMEVSTLPSGSYWLKLSDDQGRQASYQIQKITQ